MFNLPNLLTLINLFSGGCAIVCLNNGQYKEAVYWLIASGIADFGDGLVARAMNISSPIGKQLDSLADMVSFGLAPGMMFYQMLSEHFSKATFWGVNLYAALAFVLTCFACLRLAKFNLDTRQSDSFIGLATPAMTLFVAGVLLIFNDNAFGMAAQIAQPMVLYPMIAILSYLMISEIPMFSFKMKNAGWKGNELRFSFLILAILQFIFLGWAGLCTVVITYVCFSLFENIRKA